MRASPVPLLLLGGLLLAGCNRGTTYGSSGEARPTVSGVQGATFADAEAAKVSFTRSGGPITAVLEDASWIRLEPDPDKAQERHPEYFEGYTVVEVSLFTQQFARPTDETYLLEDSTGARVTAKPERFRGDTMRAFGPKHYAEFTLVFPHAMSKDVRWLRLTRQAPEGGSVEWEFPK